MKENPSCLICNDPIESFMSFGKMPLANAFLSRDDFAREHFFELNVCFCLDCGMVQLMEQPDREKMFHKNYAFFSSTSSRMADHFQRFAQMVISSHLSHNQAPFLVEIGSNDGIMLRHIAAAGIRHVGVEPSENVGDIAREKGINTISEFFDTRLAEFLVSEYGHADVITAANVLCHVPYLHSVAEGAGILLKPDGVLIFEDPYLGDIIKKTSYDQIYDEHAFYFSVYSVANAFKRHALEIIKVEPQNVHGGSMRYFIARRGVYPVDESVQIQIDRESVMGLSHLETYMRFRQKVEHSRDRLMAVLYGAKQQGKRTVGYAATSKSTTVTNYCGITPDLIDFISDTTPIKQGKFSPGTHIPILPYEEFKRAYPDYALLFGWNHGEEIMAKEADFQAKGGKWIVYVPEVKVL